MASPLDAFERQALGCERIGSPFTAALCRAIPVAMGRSRLADRLGGWPGDAAADALALRVCGGLHALVLTGASSELKAVYPPHDCNETALIAALRAAIAEHDAFLCAYLDQPPQTNETARSSMILGAALIVADRTGLPLTTFEIGASAGLNLWFSRYGFELGDGLKWGRADAPLIVASDWSGACPRRDVRLDVVSRRGCDRNPLDPRNPDDRLRLLSYIWPDQPARLDRMRRALDYAAHRPPVLDRQDAGTWLKRQLEAAPEPGLARMVYHTVVWQYLPTETQMELTATLGTAGAAASPQTPLAWFRFETDNLANGSDGGLMQLTLWPGGETEVLGRADFHGRWVRWA
ncbi:MAG: DUF2332 family protein [Alphaproteobacteria bacterium]|nr:DUF2332 family protein [Alphaproteobacteria bacterium]